MAKTKPKSKTEKKPDAEAKDDSPYAGIKKRILGYQIAAFAGIAICTVLFGASVGVVVYSGVKSMSAFEDLPKYRINTLALDYRAAVKKFDQSMAATQSKLDGDEAQIRVHKSRALTHQILQSEQAFDQMLEKYAEAMALAAEQVGGALEWNRYFQADIQALRDSSSARQAKLQGILDDFPTSKLPDLELTIDNEIGSDQKASQAASTNVKN